MRKQFVYIMAVLLLLLIGCTNDDTDEKTNETPEESTGVAGDADEEEVELEGEADEGEEPVEEALAPMYELNPATWGLEPINDENAQVVLLTFDDAPDKHAFEIAKTLKELDAPAIFFVNGHFLATDEKKQLLKEIHELGFTIGNHTKTHADLQQLSEEEQREEILSVNDVVEEVTGERPRFFRAPFGQNTDFSRALAKEEGMLLMNWSFGYDWEKQYMDKTAIADIMVNTELLQNGANLLMHDREWTAEALPEIIKGLRAKGYDFVNPDTIKGLE